MPALLLTRQGTTAYPIGQQFTDQSWSKVGAEHPCSRDELAQQLFKTDDLPRPGWARPHKPWLPGSQQRSRARDACKRQLGAMTDLRCEREHVHQQSRERQQQSPLRLRFRLTQGCWNQHAPSRRSPSSPQLCRERSFSIIQVQ